MNHARTLVPALTVALLLAGLLVSPAAAAPGYELVWADEFDGTAVDGTYWTFETGNGCPNLCGWGNNELQYYRSQNAAVAGGFLTITAKQESFGGSNYTSARLVTRNKLDFTYGRVEMRARLPIGQGLWPAFWLLYTDGVYGGWAASGEIDIMEYIGSDPDRVFGTIHYGGPFPNNVYSSAGDHVLGSGTFHDGFHEFALEWEPDEMRWYVDDILYGVRTDWYSTGGLFPAPFDADFHILLNLAVGGNLPGNPDGSTVFPQEYVIDYVRVYQKPETAGCSSVIAGLDHANPFGNGWFTFNGSGGGGISPNTASLPPSGGNLASLGVGYGSGGSPGFFGGFGRNNPRDLGDLTHFRFWIDPDPGQDYQLVIQFQDDDNGDYVIPESPDGADDEFQTILTVKPTGGDIVAGGGWQQVDFPLSTLVDDNSYHWGGNGVFDPFQTGNGGLVNVVVSLVSNSGADISFRTDRWEFVRLDGSVEGRVFLDDDGDGTQDGGEAGASGIPVVLRDADLVQVAATVTDGDGDYAFPGLEAAEYRVDVDGTAGSLDGSTPTADPDGAGTPDIAWVASGCSGALAGQDFAYEPAAVGIGDGPGPRTALLPGAPNPFRASSRLSFTLAAAGETRLSVYDLAGRRVRVLQDRFLDAGRHDVRWDGRDEAGREVASGVYLVVLRTADEQRTRRLLRIR